MAKFKKGDTVVIPNIDIDWLQGSAFHHDCSLSGISFLVEDIFPFSLPNGDNPQYKLIALGYGDVNHFGNGAVYINENQLEHEPTALANSGIADKEQEGKTNHIYSVGEKVFLVLSSGTKKRAVIQSIMRTCDNKEEEYCIALFPEIVGAAINDFVIRVKAEDIEPIKTIRVSRQSIHEAFVALTWEKSREILKSILFSEVENANRKAR